MPDYSLKVIDELKQTLGFLGVKRTIDALKKARVSGDPVQLHISFITDLICGSFSTTLEKMKEEKGRQNDTSYAKAFIIHYLRIEFKIDWKEIKELLDRDQSSLFRCGKMIKQLDARLVPHRPYCQKKEFFDQKVKQYKTQLNKQS